MSISRTYSSGWGVGERLTSAQMNSVDQNSTYGLDKRSGQQDVFMSLLVATGAGRVVKTVQTGPDANKTFHVMDGNSIVRVPTLTAARTFTLGHTGATGGDRMFFYMEGTGATASGYANIVTNQGTGLFRLGVTNTTSPNDSCEGDAAEFIFAGGTWKLMYGAGPGMRHVEFTSSTTWVCPPGVFEILLIGYGGGGGGGTGASVQGTIGGKYSGGGGGGGSQLRVQRVPVVPGRSYTITIGAGGASDADGGDSTFSDTTLATTLASFVGASRGFRGGFVTGTSSWTGGVTGHSMGLAFGGAGARIFFVTSGVSASPSGPFSVPTGNAFGVPSMMAIYNCTDYPPHLGPAGPGAGGPGVTVNFPPAVMRHGFYSTETYAGGTAGQHGGCVAGLLAIGGGGGGGGGGGPGGIGGQGGTGGDAFINSIGKAGVAGGTGAPNTGAGGGGGGGAGIEVLGPLGGGAGGAGGQGGSGKLTVVFWK